MKGGEGGVVRAGRANNCPVIVALGASLDAYDFTCVSCCDDGDPGLATSWEGARTF